MCELIRMIKKSCMLVILLPLKLLFVKNNRIVLFNNLGGKYADNPKYIAEFLVNKYQEKFQIIFSVDDVKKHKYLGQKNIIPVQNNSFRYYCYALSSKVIVTNNGGISYLPLRKKQYVINTWHGGGAYKTVGIHSISNSSWLYKKDMQLSAKKTNCFLSTTRRFTEKTSEALLIPQDKFWEIGMPRNDILIRGDKAIQKKIRCKLGLKENEKLVLFAPTFRNIDGNVLKDFIAVSYGVDAERVCKALQTRFGGNWKFGLRLHPRAVNKSAYLLDGVINLTDYEDMQELLLAADVMINDFSSSMWDFMLTCKPCFTFALDLQNYIDTRNVYTPVSEWPFPQAATNDELERNILNFNAEEYAKACERHYQDLGGCETGQAAKLVCERIYDVCFK